MAPKTLYDIVRPICWRLNMFGYNYGNEKPAGWMRRGYKMAVKCMLLYIMYMKSITDCMGYKEYTMSNLGVEVFELLLTCSFCLQFFFMKEDEMEEMMKRMKQHPVGKMSQKKLNKQLIPFKIYSALFAIFALAAYSMGACTFILDFQQGRKSFIWAAFRAISMLHFFMTMPFPSLLCILPCITACYCRAEMEEAMEEMKRIKSPLRRAKAGAKLMEKYRQLYELASVTDVGLSTAIYFMKWMLFIDLAAVLLMNTIMIIDPYTGSAYNVFLGIFEEYISVLLTNLLVAMYFPLFQYFYLAPSANQMFDRMNRAIVDCGFMDDQLLFHDPIAQPYLLKMRMEQVERVSHMATEDPPFTLFGDVLDNDIKYAIILELIDMCNTLSVHKIEEGMILSRIYTDFMKLCIDCNYWYQKL